MSNQEEVKKKKEIFAGLIFIGIIVLTIILNYGFSLGIKKGGIYLFVYLLLSTSIILLESKFNSGFLRIVSMIVLFPLGIAYVVLKFIQPVNALVIHVLMYFAIVNMLPILFAMINKSMDLVDVSRETFIFISLTFSSIVSIAFYELIIKAIYKFSPYGLTNTERADKLRLRELTEYVITPENIRFFIYSLYFVYLLLFSVKHIQNKSLFETEIMDGAVMQAFLVFLAFDSLRINSKGMRFLFSTLLNKIYESSIHFGERDKEESEKGKELKG